MIAALATEGHSIERACLLLGVSHSGFYAWRTRPPSARSIRHAWLTDLITNIHIDSNGVHSAPRVRAELVHGHGITVSRHAVAVLMAAPASMVCQPAGVMSVSRSCGRQPTSSTASSGGRTQRVSTVG